MPVNPLIFSLHHNNLWRHLAVEEYLLKCALSSNRVFLYLWSSSIPAVIVGKNQNPWKESDIEYLQRCDIRLARRLTGGGTVYQDGGNLNVSFFISRKHYDISRQLGIIQFALQQQGITSTVNKQWSLFVNQRKFSGSAFCFQKGNALHHSSILVHVNQKVLKKSLVSPLASSIITKAVSSTPSPTINLKEIVPNISKEKIVTSIVDVFARHYNINPVVIDGEHIFEKDKISSLEKKYSSWSWRFGYTPKFFLQGIVKNKDIRGKPTRYSQDKWIRFRSKGGGTKPTGRIDQEEIKIVVEIVAGCIKNVKTTKVCDQIQTLLQHILEGCPFEKSAIIEATEKYAAQKSKHSYHLKTIGAWMASKAC